MLREVQWRVLAGGMGLWGAPWAQAGGTRSDGSIVDKLQPPGHRVMFPLVFLPLLLIIAAVVPAAVVAYGSHPNWVQYHHGLELILWSRRLQWPLVALSLIACILLIALSSSGRRRAWWLLGLAPVLALFAHRFTTGPAAGKMTVIENPAFVDAGAAVIGDEDWIVGFAFGNHTFAYPYSRLFGTPVVIQADHDKRIMLMWSAYSNRALLVPIGREIKGRELEVVSTPANALLVYDSRRGQFINGFTGQTPQHKRPIGFAGGTALRTWKMPWKQWRAMYPETRVMAPEPGASAAAGPTQPILPAWALPPMKLDRPANTRVALAGNVTPIAVESAQLTPAPLNTNADGVPIVLFRQQPEAPLRAFDRRVFDSKGKLDVIAKFAPNLIHDKHPLAFLIDVNSNTGWNADGSCVDAPRDAGQMKGEHMEPVGVDDGVDWATVKYWYPDVQLEIAPAEPIGAEPDPRSAPSAPCNPRRRPRRKRESGASPRGH